MKINPSTIEKRNDMIRSIAIALAGILAVSFVVGAQGCTSLTGGKGWSEMSPKEQAANLLGIYNRQYDLYLKQATAPDLTDEKREILRDKKKALTELYPFLDVYSDYAARGEFAPADTEIVVMRIVDRLLGI
jgi:hypothetical protein